MIARKFTDNLYSSRIRITPRPKYIALSLVSFQDTIAHRRATLLNIVVNLIWVAVLYYLWKSVFEATPQLGTFDWQRMRTYVLVSYAVNSLLSRTTEIRMVDSVRTGSVAIELTRPVSHLASQLAQASGAAVVEGFFSSSLSLLLGILFLHIAPPASQGLTIFLIISIGLGFLIKFLITYLTTLLCFWTLNAMGLRWARAAITNILSGALFPLELYPNWIQPVLHASPFQAIIHIPLTIYFGNVSLTTLVQLLAIQFFWIVVLWLLAYLLWIPSLKALQIQGG